MQDYDPEIKHAFEVADDSLQGVLGYHYFAQAVKYCITEDQLEHLPDGIGFNLGKKGRGSFLHTISWERYFCTSQFIGEMNRLYNSYESRISLVSMISVFEAALGNFIRILRNKQLLNPQTINQNGKERKITGRVYKYSLIWAHIVANKCSIGDKSAIERLSDTFGMIDNARRLRNRIVHDNGLFKENYRTDTIKDQNGRELFNVQMHPRYSRFKENPQENVPIMLEPNEIVDFSRAHVEVLHILHNSIQENFFKCAEPYDYRKEGKSIEWTRILTGV